MPSEKNSEYYLRLLQRWQERTCTPSEATELLNYLQSAEADRVLVRGLKEAFPPSGEVDPPAEEGPGNRVRLHLLQHIETENLDFPEVKLPWYSRYTTWVAAAAIAGTILAGSIYYIYPSAKNKKQQTALLFPQDIAPGKNRAVLTLANGEKIILDTAGNGLLAQQGNTNISNQGGQLTYKGNAAATDTVYNTLSTAPGETYVLRLADGSKVWLNAASSLRFPAAFAGKERRVELTGEAYFEIAPNASQPFKVSVGTANIQVLGTSFNVNAYTDESTINTTLIQGAVRVQTTVNTLQLIPGEQAQSHRNGKQCKVSGVNTDQIIAWKEGFFQFDNTDLATVLKQFSHWYNIEIIYEGEGPIKERKFFGVVNRNTTLMNVLKILDSNDVRFRLEGRKLIVQGE